MTRWGGRLTLLLVLGFAAALAGAPLGAQQGAAETPRPEPEGTLTPTPGLEEIDEILKGEEEALAGGGDVYDAGDRRDPFKSLLVVTDQPALEGPRPEGIPGLLIDEVVLSGIYRTRDGYIAQVQAADRQKSYLLKAGDQLFDGDVIAINRNEVVFRQNVQDPTALKPFREVVKALNPP